MSATTFAAKWGAGPTLAAALVGGVGLAASVSVFQMEAIGKTLGILSETLPMVGPAMQEGKDAVGDPEPAVAPETAKAK